MFLFVSGPGKFAEGVNYGNIKGDSGVSNSTFNDTVQMARAAAAYRACAENKADFIIYPRYVVRVEDYFFYKEVTAKVMGYKGVLQDVKVKEDKQSAEASEMIGYLKDIKDNLSSMKQENPRENAEMNEHLKDISDYLKSMNDRDVQKAEKKEESEKAKTANIREIKY